MEKVRALLSAFLAVLIAVGLTAFQLLPTAEYLLQSQRAGSVDYDYAMNYSFIPLRFLTLFAANLFGSPAQGNYLLKADNYWEDAIYIGLLPLLLCFGAIATLFKRVAKTNADASQRKQEKALILFLLVVSIISFIFAMGKNTPIFPFLYRYIPTFNMFQAPARFTIWAEFGLALLAGIGASNWIKPTGWSRYWTNLGIAAGAAVVLGSALAMILFPGVGNIFISATAIAGIIVIISGFLSKNAPVEVKREPGKIWKWLVILLNMY